MSTSVATRQRLAWFYNMSILALFDPPQANPSRVRPADRKVLEAGPGIRMELLSWGNTLMEPPLFRIAPSAGSAEPYTHERKEFLYMLEGCIEIELDGGERERLEKGNSYYFVSSTPHYWWNPRRAKAWVLWVSPPPRFDGPESRMNKQGE